MGSAVGVPSSVADQTSGGADRASDREREGNRENEMSGARGLVLGLLPAGFRRSRPPEQNHLSPAVQTAGNPPVHVDIRRFSGGLDRRNKITYHRRFRPPDNRRLMLISGGVPAF
ncbi:hypothetical protein MA16_Dca010419 [Dendrobium catenatum]|uniref:Uncharacterized protein n=1 Tax=Dendrobium catenatum TaxID=906689 RepID=A0A2I0XBH7_9ASPA|nr:hypothetical protein MA16_Dca010419 [Dendrobium catenatum]